MKRTANLSVLLSVFAVTCAAVASPTSWLHTRYRANPHSTGSSYRSPVTDGHLDIYLLLENVTFTDAEFSIKYDAGIVHPITAANVLELAPGLSLVSVTTENLEGTWKKSTLTLSGPITIGEIVYISEAALRVRFVSHSEGTMPVSLWPRENYPASYHTCSLNLWDDGVEVVHNRKEWNDGTVLFAFTDKTAARVMYHYDMNFGTPVEGYLQVVYEDDSIEEFHVSDHDKGITIDPAFGAYFLTAQPDAVSHTMIFPGYESWINMDLTSGFTWSVSHSQPSGHLYVKEKYDGFYGIKASPEDIVLTIEQPGIGVDFENTVYRAAIAGDQTGILTKTFRFAYISDDVIELTLEGGLEPDWNYNLYVFKDDVILGRTWFSASVYYPVIFTVQDEQSNPLPNALVVFPIWGHMGGASSISERTDENGQAFFELPGQPEWGHWHEYRVVAAGYESAYDYIEVYDVAVDHTVTMIPASGVNLADFARFAAWWQMQDCLWYGDCDGADMNFDGTVDAEDLFLFMARWLNDM